MSEQLLFVPLGGSGEIGMNLNLYGYEDTWMMVDCGMMISSESGEDQILVPEIEYLRQKKLAGLVLTHAHEDHIGAITDLWLELRCPLYTTPFTAAVIRRKLAESAIKERVPFKIQPPGGRFQVGEFKCEFVPVTHSTVESQAVLIKTPVGDIFHTGDWKLDPEPLVGKKTALKRIREIGEAGVLAVVGDSTNSQIEGTSGSESMVRARLRELIKEARGRVVCSSFSSNIARLETFLVLTDELKRNPVLVGRSMKRMVAAAQETGYLPRNIPFVPPRDAMFLPPERTMLICTGSQGEARAALSRIAARTHPDIGLDEGDTVFFSSKMIPGNEIEIEQLQAALSDQGVKVISEESEPIHVSGHPCRDELTQMYGWLKPQILIPVHGYPPHLEAHAELGRECGIPEVIEVRNGDIVTLEAEDAYISGSAPVGRRLRPPEPSRHRGGRSQSHDRSRRGKRGGRAQGAPSGRNANRGAGRRSNQGSGQSSNQGSNQGSGQGSNRGGKSQYQERGSSWLGDRPSRGRQSFLAGFGGRQATEDSSEGQGGDKREGAPTKSKRRRSKRAKKD